MSSRVAPKATTQLRRRLTTARSACDVVGNSTAVRSTEVGPVSSRVWKFGDDIDTDVLAPGAYMKLGLEGIAPHCLESVRPEFAASVRPGDVVVAGANFGIGSSREQAVGVLLQLGVRAVIAPAFSGLYFRNAFNLGLLLLTCARAGELRDGERITLDLQALTVTSQDGVALACEPIPDFLLDMVAAGGLLNQLRARLGKTAAATPAPAVPPAGAGPSGAFL